MYSHWIFFYRHRQGQCEASLGTCRRSSLSGLPSRKETAAWTISYCAVVSRHQGGAHLHVSTTNLVQTCSDLFRLVQTWELHSHGNNLFRLKSHTVLNNLRHFLITWLIEYLRQYRDWIVSRIWDPSFINRGSDKKFCWTF